MRVKYLYTYTIGCQMNVYDSEQFARILSLSGYRVTDSLDEADLVIVNTCSIREKAEEKAFSFLGRMASCKKRKPGMLVGVGGCVAQQEGEKILRRVPCVDFVFGTHAVHRLPEIVKTVSEDHERVVDTGMTEEIIEPFREFDEKDVPAFSQGSLSSFVTIMRGCDNFCTYCVVPYTRGRETSRDPQVIVNEITSLVRSGIKEVTLLGQNVNSYGKKEGLPSFPELLYTISEIEGLERIRFATSHPKDMSDDLIKAYGEIDKLCNHIHLPVQSGSNDVLKRMNRKYTREIYLGRIEKLRSVCPDIAVTSDMIVGFCGETEKDFEDTVDLVKTVEFDGLFAFAYSDRDLAPASRFRDKVPFEEKRQRLQTLLALQEDYTRRKNEAVVGNVETVLVEGHGKIKNDGSPQWTGRTAGNKIVNFFPESEKDADGKRDLTGKMISVRIKKALAHSLLGEET